MGNNMLKSPTLKLLRYLTILSFMMPSLLFAQTASEITESRSGEVLAHKAVADPVFAQKLSNELSRCHGFLYELHDHLTKEIEMNLDTIKAESTLSQDAQIYGYAAVLIKTYHSESIKAAHTYANAISHDARSVWRPTLKAAKTNILVISMPEIRKCAENKPVAEWLFAGALAHKSK